VTSAIRLLTLEPFERHPGRVIAAIGGIFAVMYVTALTLFPRSHGRIVDGDAIQYYAYLRSLVMDGDLDFANDYRMLYRPTDEDADEYAWLREVTPTGRAQNMMSIGPALLWAPAFLVIYAGLSVLRALGLSIPLDGVAAPFQLSVGVAGIVYATLGSFLCYRVCRVLYSQAPAFWGALAAWLATPAVYYSLVSPAYSHAVSLFAAALFCYVWLTTRGDRRIWRHLLLGALAGLTALVRWQEVIVLALPMGELVAAVAKRRQSSGSAVLRLGLMAGSFTVIFAPQLIAWRHIYGDFLVMPQGGEFMRWTDPALGSVLFSLRHGLFTWTPVLLLSVCGLLWLIRRDPLLGWSALVVILLAVYINASVSDWWAGEAFGARRFVGYTVFFALGLTALFARNLWVDRLILRRWTATGLIVYNLLFLVQYQLFMRGFRDLVPYPTTARQVFLDRLSVPWTLLRAWLNL